MSGHDCTGCDLGRRRFLRDAAVGTALAAFALNEACYAALLLWTRLGYRTALVLVLVGVAAFTYVAGRRWAFAAPRVGASGDCCGTN